jgi:[amino group carrier protein]-L-2-aminoadipate 6-kinase
MTIVVKVGGAVGNSLRPVLSDLAARKDFVLVHGGSREVDRISEELGRPPEYYTSPSGVVSRRSDPAHLEVVILALAGKVQTEIVAGFTKLGVHAVGLSGVDDWLLLARRKEGPRAVIDGRTVRLLDDLSGTIEEVNTGLLRLLLDAGIIPVVGPPAVSREGEVLNVDADRAAASIAAALGAQSLVLLTNVPGLLRDPDQPSSLIPRVGRAELDGVLPLARGRMRKKVLAAREALEGGVASVVIAPSGVTTPVTQALAGHGTVIE